MAYFHGTKALHAKRDAQIDIATAWLGHHCIVAAAALAVTWPPLPLPLLALPLHRRCSCCHRRAAAATISMLLPPQLFPLVLPPSLLSLLQH